MQNFNRNQIYILQFILLASYIGVRVERGLTFKNNAKMINVGDK